MEKTIAKIVDELLFELYLRNGFDDWWASLDAEIQTEIKEAMAFRARQIVRELVPSASSFSIAGDVSGLVQGNNVAVTMDFHK